MLQVDNVASGLKIRSDGGAHHPPSSPIKTCWSLAAGSSGYNSTDQTCTCLLGGRWTFSKHSCTVLLHRTYGMLKWKQGARCRAVISDDEGHRGKTNYCILDIMAGDYTGKDSLLLFWWSHCINLARLQLLSVICVGFEWKSPLRVELMEEDAGTGAILTTWLFSIGMDDKPSTERLLCCAQITM